MKHLKLFSFLVIVLSAGSCKSHTTEIKETVDKFADLECRAMTLREARFTLADKLRFTQDTLLHTANKADTVRLHSKIESFNKEKDTMLKQSLSLADSIHNELNDLMKNELKDKNDKATFDQMLNNTLIERGCVKKS